ncbi:GDSL-type esterase/lipase family protein, partial [Nonomuraea sp. NPDC004297]
MVWAAGMARAARRIATAAALGGGGLTALGATAYGLLIAEGLLARKAIGQPHGLDGPQADGMYGAYPGVPLRMVMLGDSTSVGLGVTGPASTPGVLLANGLAAVAERPVRLLVAGKSGTPSAFLDEQVDVALAMAPDLAVIFVGANDIITQTPPAVAVRHLAKAVRRLR